MTFKLQYRSSDRSLSMKSAVLQNLPSSLRRSLSKLGADLSTARRKRHLTVAMMAERIGVAKSTYSRMESGDPAVALGAFAMALFVLGLGDRLNDLIDVRTDDLGLLTDEERLPKRVRPRKDPAPL
jgi:DNA-binding XRE family transcriptional regulator